MKHIKSFKLFTENPDAIPWEEAEYKDKDARPFWIVDGRSYIGEPSATHASMIEMYGLLEYNYSGRIWTDKKLISFWNYPEPEELYPILNSLEICFRNVWNEDIKILYNEYKIEVIENDMLHGHAISLEDYIESKHTPNEEWKEHIKSPSKKDKTVPYNKSMNIADRQKLYQESNTETYKNGKMIIKNHNLLVSKEKPIGNRPFNYTQTQEVDIEDYKNPKPYKCLTELEKGHVNTMDWNQYIKKYG